MSHEHKKLKKFLKAIEQTGLVTIEPRGKIFIIKPFDKSKPIYNCHNNFSSVKPVNQYMRREFNVDLNQ